MKKHMKKYFPLLHKIIVKLKLKVIGYSLKSYSQEGEDMILRRVFNDKSNGFFVDVGAHHPERFSNTFFFYKLGWKGINIDAMPGSMDAFKRKRPLDINLEIPISNSGKELIYYKFNEPALNGFSKKLTELRINESNSYYVEDEITLKTYRLSEVLESHMPKYTDIDFMTIDVEGLDFEVLQSNDWERFRPKMVLVEILENSIEDFFSNDVYLYLKSCGYQFYAKTVNTIFFHRSDFTI